MRRMWRRQFIVMAFTGLSAAVVSGCGTILHPERRGQPAGRLDWKIVALDALGLILFFIPGVIAFAVDFATGAIYLPNTYVGQATGATASRELVTVKVPDEKLTPAKIEEVVSKHAQREVRLLPGQYETAEMNSVDQFWSTHDRMNVASASTAG